MEVKLISYSTPSVDLSKEGIKNAQDLVAFCARVSNPSNQLNIETSAKLIKYLIKHQHWSPLEMVSACLEVTTTRDIARQMLRHRSFSFQEFSQRYADPTQDLDFEIRDTRLQDTKNRQNSIDIDFNDPELRELDDIWKEKQAVLIRHSKEAYTWAVSNGIAKEQARAVLPEGLTVSRMYMKGSIRSWIHYIMIRSGVETQKEHREVATACASAIQPIFPMIRSFING